MKNSLKEFLADGVKISSLTEVNWNAFFLKSKKKKKKEAIIVRSYRIGLYDWHLCNRCPDKQNERKQDKEILKGTREML